MKNNTCFENLGSKKFRPETIKNKRSPRQASKITTLAMSKE
jgi:hypothetical protein